MFEIIKKTETTDASKSKASKHDSKPEPKHHGTPGKNSAKLNKMFGGFAKNLMTIYVLFYLAVFPLCIHDHYYDILTFRFGLFWKPTLAYGIIFALMGLFYLVADGLYNEGKNRKDFFTSLKNKGWKKYIGPTDIAITALILVFALSTAFAEYPYEAFWGNRGRWQGLLLWLMFYIAYILITRFYEFKKWHIYAFMLGASIVVIWGICNFFLINFGMFEGTKDEYKYIFVSSIGNINTYCNFTGMFFGVASAMFILQEKPLENVLNYIFLALASFGQIMGISENAMLSTAIVFAVLPFCIVKTRTHMAKFFIVLSTYLAAMKITAAVTLSGMETMNDLDPSQQITLAGKSFLTLLLIFILALTALSLVNAFKNKEKTEDKDVKIFKLIWKIVLAAGIVLMVTVLVCANKGIHSELWEPYRYFLIFDDWWGTGRGLNWRLGMEYWLNDSTFLAKIIGYGPDTYYIITMDRFMNIMEDAGYGMFDSAHNEYFEYLITVGILGLASYIILLYTALRTKLRSQVSGIKATAVGVIAYAFQAVVNIAVPITTPVFMILMFIGCGKKVKTKDKMKILMIFLIRD